MKSGQRQAALALFRAVAVFASGGDVSTLISSFLNQSYSKDIKQSLSGAILVSKSKLCGIVARIKAEYGNTHDDLQKQALLRPVSNLISSKLLNRDYGWEVGTSAWRSSCKPKRARREPPRCRRLPVASVELIRETYLSNTVPVEDQLVYAKKIKSVREYIPAVARTKTKRQGPQGRHSRILNSGNFRQYISQVIRPILLGSHMSAHKDHSP
jgi:hypothetical protein